MMIVWILVALMILTWAAMILVMRNVFRRLRRMEIAYRIMEDKVYKHDRWLIDLKGSEGERMQEFIFYKMSEQISKDMEEIFIGKEKP